MKEQITVNYINGIENKMFEIVPLTMQREWMHKSLNKFAYKCLPLGIANQYGWVVLSPVDFSVSWYGGTKPIDVEVFSEDERFRKDIFGGHFGESTFTVIPDFILQTPEGYSTYIRGIPNYENKFLKPLDAIVETDWLPFTFTYNFKFVEPGTVDFKKGDPLFCFFPIERNTVENFSIFEQNLVDNKILFNDFNEYAKSRHDFNKKRPVAGEVQKFYINGRGPNKIYSIKNHIKRLFFKEVTDRIE